MTPTEQQVEAGAWAAAKVIAARHCVGEPTREQIQYWMGDARREEVSAALSATPAQVPEGEAMTTRRWRHKKRGST